MLRGVNLGSGQRRFESVPGVVEWVNVDCQSVPPDRVPDIVADGRNLPRGIFPDNSVDIVVLHHVLEHFGCGEADRLVQECRRVLKPGGSLIVTVPDLRALAKRWLLGQLNDFLYCAQLYGAFMGDENDRHRWGYTPETLRTYLDNATVWEKVKAFDWREIPGAEIARDWYIVGVEAIK